MCVKNPKSVTECSQKYFSVKLRPIIEYGAVVWSCSLSIQNCQVEYIRETHRYGKKSCITAMMMDLSEIEIGNRIGAIREKYSIKCLIKKVPRRIYRYFETKDQLPKYSKIISRDDTLPSGYVNVEKHDGRKNYRSFVKFSGRKRTIYFYSNYAKDAEKQRISWINRNMNIWYEHHKPPETVFNFDKFYISINSSNLIDHNEVEEWRNIVGGDKEKLWKYIKKISKIRTKMKQETQWNEGNVGNILKQFKNKWYDDKLINVIENDKVHLLKKLRIGNSKLRRHCKGGPLKICINCDDNKVESIHHYLMECKKYENQRNILINNVHGPLDEMGCNITTKILLGFFDDVFQSRIKTQNHFKNMSVVIGAVINFITQTGRFN